MSRWPQCAYLASCPAAVVYACIHARFSPHCYILERQLIETLIAAFPPKQISIMFPNRGSTPNNRFRRDGRRGAGDGLQGNYKRKDREHLVAYRLSRIQGHSAPTPVKFADYTHEAQYSKRVLIASSPFWQHPSVGERYKGKPSLVERVSVCIVGGITHK